MLTKFIVITLCVSLAVTAFGLGVSLGKIRALDQRIQTIEKILVRSGANISEITNGN